jgi:hypothetical protein
MTWEMAREFVQYIIECAEDGIPVPIDFSHLPERFKERWALTYDSRDTRSLLQNLIRRKLRIRLNEYGTTDMFAINRRLNGLTGGTGQGIAEEVADQELQAIQQAIEDSALEEALRISMLPN